VSNESGFTQRNPIKPGSGVKENKAGELPSMLMRFLFARNIPRSFGDKCEY